MAESKIEWTEQTWNPVTGCTHISKGCSNCYAERMSKRLKAMGQKKYANGFNVTLHPDSLHEPLKIKKPTVFFVCSMGDLFHNSVPFSFIDSVHAVAALCPQHTFIMLTKRSARLASYCSQYRECEIRKAWSQLGYYEQTNPMVKRYVQTWPNIWYGVTVCNQEEADEKIVELHSIPSENKFISFEPLLEEIDVDYPEGVYGSGPSVCCSGHECGCGGGPTEPPLIYGIKQVIAGCESGPGRRYSKPLWFRILRDQCAASGVAFMLKQMEANGKLVKMPELDGVVHSNLIWTNNGG